VTIRKTFWFQCKMPVESKYQGSLSESFFMVFPMFVISAAVFSDDNIKKILKKFTKAMPLMKALVKSLLGKKV